MDRALKKLLLRALGWRVFLTVFQYVVNVSFEDFDSSTFLSKTTENTTQFVKSAQHWPPLFNGFSKWDAVYFLHIAQHGYTYEQMVVFYPAFPSIMSTLSNRLTGLVTTTTALQGVSYAVNLIYFLLAVYFFFKLTFKLSKCDVRFASISTLLMIINPATVFMMASYSEAQFLFLQIALLYFLEVGSYRVASLFISVSMVTRSNGFLNVAFFAYFYLKDTIRTLKDVTSKGEYSVHLFLKSALYHMVNVCFCLLVMFFPLIYYHLDLYELFCLHPHMYARTSTLKDHWCNWSIPFSYPYVQSHYWNVGLFNYYEPKQIPNFLLAAPIVYIVFFAAKEFFTKVDRTSLLAAFGFTERTSNKEDLDRDNIFIPHDVLLVYLLHALFLTLYGLVGFHVQILTRMMCSSTPVVYWSAATMCVNAVKKGRRSGVCVYFLVYVLVGTTLHVNFYPWT